MKIVYSGCSHQGQVRKNNEDAFLMRTCEDGALFLVADGIGGRAHGEVASTMLREGYCRWWKEQFLSLSKTLSFPEAVQEFKRISLSLNREIVSRFGEWNTGSTAVVLLMLHGNYACLSIGDSRLYLARMLSFRQVTVDDVVRGRQGKAASNSGKLVGAMGINAIPEFHIRTDRIRRGDRFFLCSDGVYQYVKSSCLRLCLMIGAVQPPERITSILAGEVEKNGAGDNYTMICVKVRKP